MKISNFEPNHLLREQRSEVKGNFWLFSDINTIDDEKMKTLLNLSRLNINLFFQISSRISWNFSTNLYIYHYSGPWSFDQNPAVAGNVGQNYQIQIPKKIRSALTQNLLNFFQNFLKIMFIFSKYPSNFDKISLEILINFT